MSLWLTVFVKICYTYHEEHVNDSVHDAPGYLLTIKLFLDKSIKRGREEDENCSL